MSTRTEREKNKRQHDKHLGILMELLREDQNKYCADCRAKGPRWASWNLGIFVCITCAGIHRNLGVHISKVKSVNLDAWTPEQIKNIQEWGNKRAAQYYEFHLPEGFRRPQGDSYHSLTGDAFFLSLEQFIRNKYEKKLYMNKEGPPPPHEVKAPQEKTNKERKKSPDNGNKKPQQISRPEPSKPVKNNIPAKNPELNKVTPTSSSSATADLLSLSEPPAPQNGSLLSMASTRQDTTADLFNFSGSSLHPVSTNPAHPAPVTSQGFGFDLTQPAPVSNTIQPSNTGAPSSSRPNIEDDLFKDDLSSGGQSTKDSIMALYQPSQKQPSPQMFGVPGGVYLPQQKAPSLNMNQPNTMPSQFGAPYNAQQQQLQQQQLQQQQLQQQQQQQIYQVNQVQQQMAKLGFKQPTSMSNTLGMQNNQAVPNSQAMPGYNYNQAIPGTAPYNNGSGLYANTPLANGGWMPQKAGNFPQPQPMPQYLTTGPAAPGFNMYPGQGSMPSGQTLSHNLWK